MQTDSQVCSSQIRHSLWSFPPTPCRLSAVVVSRRLASVFIIKSPPQKRGCTRWRCRSVCPSVCSFVCSSVSRLQRVRWRRGLIASANRTALTCFVRRSISVPHLLLLTTCDGSVRVVLFPCTQIIRRNLAIYSYARFLPKMVKLKKNAKITYSAADRKHHIHRIRALILYRRRRFINHLLTYLLTYLLTSIVPIGVP